MQIIVVAGQSYASGALTSVVFPGATATLADGVLTLESLKGDTGDVVNGEDGTDAAFQAVVIGENEWTAENITKVEFVGAEGALDGTTLRVLGLKGDTGDASVIQGPPGQNATSVVKVRDSAGNLLTYNSPDELQFDHAVGELSGNTLTVTPYGLAVNGRCYHVPTRQPLGYRLQ